MKGKKIWFLFKLINYYYCCIYNKNDLVVRKFVSTPDGGQIAVDWTPPSSEKAFDNTPTLVMFHGLTGGNSNKSGKILIIIYCVINKV